MMMNIFREFFITPISMRSSPPRSFDEKTSAMGFYFALFATLEPCPTKLQTCYHILKGGRAGEKKKTPRNSFAELKCKLLKFNHILRCTFRNVHFYSSHSLFFASCNLHGINFNAAINLYNEVSFALNLGTME